MVWGKFDELRPQARRRKTWGLPRKSENLFKMMSIGLLKMYSCRLFLVFKLKAIVFLRVFLRFFFTLT